MGEPTEAPAADAGPEVGVVSLAEPETATGPNEAGQSSPEAEPADSQSAEASAGAIDGETPELLDAPNATAAPEAESGKESSGDDEDPTAFASRLPDLTDDETLHSALEALLLVVDSPAEVESLADALDEPVKRIRAALKTMAAQYAEQNRGIDLRDVGGGWRFYTRDKYAPFVEKLLHDGQRAKLTRAALESLAVIAYRQPVTRARVAAVRGVNVDGVIRTLLVRGLIEETGTDKDTGGILYRTTELFLERLGLSSLEDLPPIAPLLPEVDAIDDV
ncbi:SMC-Scp complex subunit ScpB [Kibdelosporangium philippinense]|uniref:SMC-Scp complex subunit ScpB n=1 Tax=Kibdelosporangium philippinense TaxID=211113 RepID=A0ABS8ZQH8_9PSEU|nr:SMC-Scp complex subunit ScpB [Kibdelosporangium philippinense]MCE7009872.1 SMC-Scp complex subunit ScpB [Kibdelosporangium philippinense]